MDAFESQLTHTYSRKLRGGPVGPESLLSEDKPARCITLGSLRKIYTHTHTRSLSEPNPVDSVLGIAIWIITAVLKKRTRPYGKGGQGEYRDKEGWRGHKVMK